MSMGVAIIGAGGHARSLIALAENCHVPVFAIYDSSYDIVGEEVISGYRLAGDLDTIPENREIIFAVGDNNLRTQLFSRYCRQRYRKNLIHKTADLANSAILGDSNQVFGRVFINTESRIGQNNIINTGAIIEHEVQIGSHNHISVGAVLCGRVEIGDGCMIGAGTVVIDNMSICDQVVIGANSTVTKSIVEPGVYVGSPVRRIN